MVIGLFIDAVYHVLKEICLKKKEEKLLRHDRENQRGAATASNDSKTVTNNNSYRYKLAHAYIKHVYSINNIIALSLYITKSITAMNFSCVSL